MSRILSFFIDRNAILLSSSSPGARFFLRLKKKKPETICHANCSRKIRVLVLVRLSLVILSFPFFHCSIVASFCSKRFALLAPFPRLLVFKITAQNEVFVVLSSIAKHLPCVIRISLLLHLSQRLIPEDQPCTLYNVTHSLKTPVRLV